MTFLLSLRVLSKKSAPDNYGGNEDYAVTSATTGKWGDVSSGFGARPLCYKNLS